MNATDTRRILPALAFLLVFAAPLTAQQPLPAPPQPPAPPAAPGPITLQEAIALAQQDGHQARAARAAHQAARYRDAAFRDRLLPQLSLSGTVPSYNRSIIQVPSQDSGHAVTLFLPEAQTTTALSLQLDQTLPLTGGSLFVSSSLTRNTVTGQSGLQQWSSVPFVVGLRQDIFRPNVAVWDHRVQNLQIEEQERAYREAMEDVALQTTGLFFAAYAARKNLDNAVTDAAVNDTLYRLNTGRFQVGRIGENDLLQSQLALLRARTSLDAARLEYERAIAQLRLGLGLPADRPLEVAVSPDVPDVEPDTALAVAEALRNASAVSDAALADVQARRSVTQAQLADGIGATLQASYGYNATTTGGWRQAYEQLADARQFTLAVQLPLWQWGAHGAGVKAAEADRARVTDQNATTLEQLAFDARFAALGLAQARRNVALLTVGDSVAGKRFEVAYNRYVIGKITIDNLYIAQQEKDAALVENVGGLRDYWLAYYRLRRLTLYDFEAGRPIR
ncbi:MAG TPA: TolC family protein [Gemmatimonadales bacterium]|nr:TolC family protein [Gemmatimonadales bacterium]